MAPGYLVAVKNRAQTNELLALRGRILPKTATDNPVPKHYDLGEMDQTSEFNLEGNMVIRSSLFQELGGFDPVMFGHEGKELTWKWNRIFPFKDIVYCPELIVYHDWAKHEDLAKKRERQSIGKKYMSYLRSKEIIGGVTVFIRTREKLDETKIFLENLTSKIIRTPIEIMIWADDSKKAVSLIRTFIPNISLRVLPSRTRTMERVLKDARHNTILLVDFPVPEELSKKLHNNKFLERIREQNECACKSIVFNKIEGNIFNNIPVKCSEAEIIKTIEDKRNDRSSFNSGLKYQAFRNIKKKVSNLAQKKVTEKIDCKVLSSDPVIVVLKLKNCNENLINRTINSILKQKGYMTFELVFLVNDHDENVVKISKKISSLPWAQRINNIVIARKLKEIVDQKDKCYLYLKEGEVLHQELISVMQINIASGFELVFGIKSNGVKNTNSEYEYLFNSKRKIKYGSINKYLDANGFTSNILVLMSRGLLDKTTVSMNKVCYLIHDYVIYDCAHANMTSVSKSEIVESNIINDSSFIEKSADRRVWLFGEKAGFGFEDNCWHFFKYCIDNHLDIEPYYVLNDGVAANFSPNYKKNIIRKGSHEWKNLLNQCEFVFLNNTARDVFVNVNEIYEYPNALLVLLTHGVAIYNAGSLISQHQYFSLVTAASNLDVNPRMRRWNYPRSKFAITGMARWDSLNALRNTKKNNQILVSLTWRRKLATKLGSSLSDSELNRFKSSMYFRKLCSFLENERLANLLEQSDSYIVVSAHFRMFELLSNALHMANPRIKIVRTDELKSIQSLIAESSLLITDYSSIMWDMSFLERPTILYQFDKYQFLKERDLLNFSIPLDDDLFDVCYSEYELLNALDNVIKSGFVLSNSKLQLLNNYLPVRDASNCLRIQSSLDNLRLHKIKPIPVLRNDFELSLSLQFDEPIHESTTAIICGDEDYRLLGISCKRVGIEDIDYQVTSGVFKKIILIPYLDNNSDLFDHFFNLNKYVEFTNKLQKICNEYGVVLEIYLSPILPMSNIYKELSNTKTKRLLTNMSGNRNFSDDVDISVIVPVFNSEGVIDACLKSISSQDYQGRYEIIIIDDGSTDSTTFKVEEFAKKNENVFLVRKINSGVGICRNYGLCLAKARYIMFVDNDDELDSSALSNLHHAMVTEQTDVAIGLMVTLSKTGRRSMSQNIYHYTYSPTLIRPSMWPSVYMNGSCVGKLYSVEYLRSNAICFPRSFNEDSFFMCQIYSKNPNIAVVNTPCYYYKGSDKPSGTKVFTSDKFRHILSTTTLTIDSYKYYQVSVEKYLTPMLRYKLLRIDRFLKKKIELNKSKISACDIVWQDFLYSDNIYRIHEICTNISDEDIEKFAPNLSSVFKVVKSNPNISYSSIVDVDVKEQLYLQIKHQFDIASIGSQTSEDGSKLFDYYSSVRI